MGEWLSCSLLWMERRLLPYYSVCSYSVCPRSVPKQLFPNSSAQLYWSMGLLGAVQFQASCFSRLVHNTPRHLSGLGEYTVLSRLQHYINVNKGNLPVHKDSRNIPKNPGEIQVEFRCNPNGIQKKAN